MIDKTKLSESYKRLVFCVSCRVDDIPVFNGKYKNGKFYCSCCLENNNINFQAIEV